MKFVFKSEVMFFVLFLFLFGCKENSSKNKKNTLKNNGNIVLVFKQPVENWKYIVEGRGFIHNGKYEISFNRNDSPISVHWSPDYLKNIDTLIIKNLSKSIEIKHKYKGLDEFSYLLEPNDTIIFEYRKQLPIAKIINREVKKYDINFEVLKRELLVKSDFLEEIKYSSPFFYLIENQIKNQSKNKLKEYKDQKLRKAKRELVLEKKILDSLHYNSLLSNEVYNFYVTRNFYNTRTLDIKEGRTINYNSNFIKENDSLLNFSFFVKYLKSIVHSEFEKKTKVINFSNARVPDFRIVYDSINNSNQFSRKEKKYLSFLWLEKIITNFSAYDISKYFQKFKKTYKDNILVSYFNSEYNLSNEISDELNLKDLKDNKTNLRSILNANKGKVIYLDFWASWCAPCRDAMPASKKLKEDFKNRKIIFVYLAWNDKSNKWVKASEKEGLKNFEHNYIIENSKSSKLLDDLNLESIPRYILYDKNGKLIHKNAPGPKTEEIRTLLNTLLID